MSHARRLKWLLTESDVRAGTEGETLPLMSVSISSGVRRREASDMTTRTASEDLSNYKVCRAGDLVINRMRAFQGALGIAPEDGVVSPDYAVLRVDSEIDKRWLYYYLTSGYTVSTMASMVRGIGGTEAGNVRTPRLNVSDLGSMTAPLASTDEQCAIADYLDRETARIDTLIEEQQRLIELLRERRKGIIERSLIGGLDADVGMARTEVSWLSGAEVATHWRTSRIKYVTSEMRAGVAITATDIEAEGPYPVFGGNGLRGYTDSWTHSGTFILIGRQGALCGNVHLAQGRFWASEHAIVATPSVGVDARWLAHMLHLMNLGQYSMTAAQPGIGVGQIQPLELPLPPLTEQQRIAAHLDHEITKIDELIAETKRFIELACERRAALITAAVTGQMDVGEMI